MRTVISLIYGIQKVASIQMTPNASQPQLCVITPPLYVIPVIIYHLTVVTDVPIHIRTRMTVAQMEYTVAMFEQQ